MGAVLWALHLKTPKVNTESTLAPCNHFQKAQNLEYLSALHPVIALFLFYRTMTLIKKINLLINDNGRA